MAWNDFHHNPLESVVTVSVVKMNIIHRCIYINCEFLSCMHAHSHNVKLLVH